MAGAASTFDSERAQSYYYGCLVRLYTTSEIRYEGFVFYLDCKYHIIGLRNVKSFGTEGRRKDGPQVPPTERLFEYKYFRGSHLQDLHVLSSPSAQTTSDLPDDPAIIKPRNLPLPDATISLVTPSTFQSNNIDSNTQSGVQAPPFQWNLLPQPVKVSPSQASTNYWHKCTGITEGSCSQQQQFTLPQLPQHFMLTNATQEPMQNIIMKASLAESASNVTEAPRPLLPPVSAGSLPLIATLPPPSSVQDCNASFAHLFSNFTINSMQNNASSNLPTATVNSSSEAVSSSGANPVVPPVTQTGQSFLCPPYPIIPRAVSSTVGITSSFDWKASSKSHPDMQPGIKESSASHPLKDGNNDAKIVASASENTELLSPEPPKALNTEPNKGYQRYRSPDESGNAKSHGPSLPQDYNINPGKGYMSSLPVAKFTEDFDFEKMNQSFNKVEVWDALGKGKSDEGDDNEGNVCDAIDEAGDVWAKLEQPIYSKDDFFDSTSCRPLDVQSAGRGKMKMTEQRRIDFETFNEIRKPQKGRGVMRPQRGGSSRSLYNGRGSYTTYRGGRANNWKWMAKN